MMKRSIRGYALAAGIALGASVLSTPVANAHDAVVESNPAADSTIEELPEQITLTFSGIPQEGFNTIALSRDGEVLTSETPEEDDHDLTINLPDDVESKPGNYTVGYQITSSDGHATRGSYDFQIAGEQSSEQSGADTQQGEKEGETSGVPSWLLPLGGIVVIAAALVMAIMRFRGIKDD